MTYTREQIDAMVAIREQQLARWSGYQFWGDRPVLSGLLGEVGLAERYGAEVDMRHLPYGDGGVDFEFQMGAKCHWFSVDAKGSKYGDTLKPKARKLQPLTIYVLVHVNLNSYARECVGWEFGTAFLKEQAENWCGNGEYVYALDRSQLKSMELMDKGFRAWRVPLRNPRQVINELSPQLTGSASLP